MLAIWPSERSNSAAATAMVMPDEMTGNTDTCRMTLIRFRWSKKLLGRNGKGDHQDDQSENRAIAGDEQREVEPLRRSRYRPAATV